MSNNAAFVNGAGSINGDISVSLSSCMATSPAQDDLVTWDGTAWNPAAIPSEVFPKYSHQTAISMAPNTIDYGGAGYAYATGTDIEFRAASCTLLPTSVTLYPAGTWSSLVLVPSGTYFFRFMPWPQQNATSDATLQIYSYASTSPRTDATAHGNKIYMNYSWRQSAVAVARVTFTSSRYVGLRVVAGTARLGNRDRHSLLEYSIIKEV